MKARDLMNRSVNSCSIDDSLHDAARVMWESDVGAVPVVDDTHRVVGMITDRDICMAAYTQGRSLKDSKVSSAMSRRLVSCKPSASLADVEQLMSEEQIRRVPVVDEFGMLQGIVTLADIARHAQSSLLSLPLETPGVARTLAKVSERRTNGSRH